MAWALRRGWIRHGHSPLARTLSSTPPKRIAELAASELIADKLPFTRSRLDAAAPTSLVASGAICGAALYGAGRRPITSGAALGASGALAGCIAEHYVRARINRNIPDLAVGLLEDAFALGGGAIIVALGARA
jgi:uncharacterized membrane protein